MSPLLIKAIVAITLALVFYTIGVGSERLIKQLKTPHLIFFWLGLIMDATGTRMMSLISKGNEAAMDSSLLNLHGVMGFIAIALMLIHAVWAPVVLVQGNEKAQRTFHRFSLIVWIIWLIPFGLGMMMGMR